MITFQRQNEILNYINKNKCASIKELAKLVWASESCVRRDIKVLEQQGFVKRVYGGVILPCQNSVVPVSLRYSFHSDVKNQLAQTAAKYIFDGATILMDNSSTVARIIKFISQFNNLKIITNNQHILYEYNDDNFELYSTGGRLISQNKVLVGSTAENYIKNIYADILFFSSQAVSDDGEISDICESETSIRKVMLSRTAKKIFLCDSSKLGAKKAFTLCTKDDIDVFICDKPLPWENNQKELSYNEII